MSKRTCSVIENGVQCGAPHNGRGYCAPHYQRWYRWGDPLASGPIRIRGRKCSFGGCENDHSALGYCSGHWKQLAESRELKPCGRCGTVQSAPPNRTVMTRSSRKGIAVSTIRHGGCTAIR